uniref:Uncharacterized protein n=1 Tax=Anguilla anguilla TaxID=7936 RepID=A0A0E9W4I1_ANGAN
MLEQERFHSKKKKKMLILKMLLCLFRLSYCTSQNNWLEAGVALEGLIKLTDRLH